MSRRRRTQSHAHNERWLVSYADFITLLFAFFVVMFASSRVDKAKATQVGVAIQEAFAPMGVSPGKARPSLERPAIASRLASEPIVQNTSGSLRQSPNRSKSLEALQKELQIELASQIRRREVDIRAEHDGLVISLREVGFFDSGSAQLREDAKNAFGRIAALLVKNGCELRIEGHTDTVPIHTKEFTSNWELSTARAVRTLTILLDEYGFDPVSVSAAGYAEYRPVASNATAEGRRMNRRVDLVVLGAYAQNTDVGEDAAPQLMPTSGVQH